jgi:protein-disulfide isomerase
MAAASRLAPPPTRPHSEDPTLSRSTPPPPQSRKERRAAERRGRRETARPSVAGRSRVSGATKPAWQSPAVLTTIGALVVGAIFIGAVLFFQNQDGGGDGTLPFGLQAPADEIPANVTVDGSTMGSATAPVLLEVYSDFQCPACGTFATETEPLLRETQVAAGTLRIVHKDAAFQGRRGDPSYDESVEAAAAAHCAGEQGSFWEYHDWLFANQDGENDGAFRDERLKAIADAIGLDRTEWDACRATGEQQDAVIAATDEAVASAGVQVTPTLFLNGTKYEGAVPYTELAALISEAAAAASPAPSASPSPSPSPSVVP